ncbi:MAG: PKD domain-containing protein [Vicinamibacterales bacterium]
MTLVVVAGLTAACDKIALTAPKDTTITLFANATTVPLNGVVEITATVIEPAGTPVQNGTQVIFTSTLGTLDPAEVRTTNGQATARFAAGSVSGTAKINAVSGAAKVTAQLELKVGGAAATRIILSANPSSVPATGGTVEVLATVLDADGNRVGGVPVSFATSAGTLSSATIFTDGNGEARTRVSTTRQATVTATAGAAQSASLTINVNTAPAVTITATPDAPTAGQNVTFTFTLNSSATGTAAVRELQIDFGDGDKLTLPNPSSPVRIAHAYAEPDTYTVTATAVDVNGEKSTSTFVIAVQAATPINITLSVEQSVGFPRNTVEPNTPVRMSVTLTPSTELQRVSSYTWDYGDGVVEILNSPETFHIYTSLGTKIVKVNVVTVDGKRAATQQAVIVTNTVPE